MGFKSFSFSGENSIEFNQSNGSLLKSLSDPWKHEKYPSLFRKNNWLKQKQKSAMVFRIEAREIGMCIVEQIKEII